MSCVTGYGLLKFIIDDASLTEKMRRTHFAGRRLID
ncbi:hypothetical protein FHS27_001942 [Rhodopirellula rubra]|uniref:Uncharacterized protein n=1 Tax=Aporhodopirellula rubra TaxID=980271 RepID=A0A7W5DXP9_9BACT|nr:hypothetical protein [Aporhodopirellula rubra]